MSVRRRLPAPTTLWSVATALALLFIGGWAAALAGRSGADFMDDLELPHPALGSAPPVESTPVAPALARRVVIVIVDGLRRDVASTLPLLGALGRRGIDSEAASQYPTWSRPNYVTILTGAPPAASGVRTNRYRGTVELDSLMDRVRASGRTAGYASDYDPLPRLFLRKPVMSPVAEPPVLLPPDLDVTALDEAEEDSFELWSAAIRVDMASAFGDPRYAPWPGGFRAAARSVLSADDPLAVLLIGVVDAAGHARGGDSPEYRAAARQADEALAGIVASLDLTRDALIVVADHGHSDSGGHGGLEPEVVSVPLVLVGAGIVPGARITGARLTDVAPTAAALLGVAAPGHGLGRTLVEALALTDDQRSALAASDSGRVARNQRIVDQSVRLARAQHLARRGLRLGLVLAGVVLAFVLAMALRRRGGLRLDLRIIMVVAPAFFIVYYTLIGTIGHRFSPSILPDRGHLASELLKYGVAGAVVHILATWLALRRRITLAERLAAANGVAWLGLVIAMLPAALLWALYPTPYVEVPTPRLLVFIPAVKVAVACYVLAVFLSLVVEVIVFFARSVDPRVRLLRLERALGKTRAELEAPPADDAS